MTASRSTTETEAVATQFAESLGSTAFVALIGPLGAGKSVFVRAVARVFGVAGPMPSPTYAIMSIYEPPGGDRGRSPVYHMDLYRISSESELECAGLLPYFTMPGLCLVEWAERARAVWPEAGWTVTITPDSETDRSIAIERFDSRITPGGTE
jgi:tRNA threonylcarbamoyladenosine biosynthesis protein TsaE